MIGRRQIALALALLSLSSTLCLQLMKKAGERLKKEQEKEQKK